MLMFDQLLVLMVVHSIFGEIKQTNKYFGFITN